MQALFVWPKRNNVRNKALPAADRSMMADEDLPQLTGYVGKHQGLVDKHFLEDMDAHTLVLKVHLMLERILRDFCSRAVEHPEHLQGARLTFKQIALLSRSLDKFQSDVGPLWPAVNHLNSLRNALAHELEPSEPSISKLERSIIAAVEAHDRSSGEHGIVEALAYLCGTLSVHLHYPLDLRSQEEAGTGE